MQWKKRYFFTRGNLEGASTQNTTANTVPVHTMYVAMLQVKIKFRLKFLTYVNSQILLSPSPDYS